MRFALRNRTKLIKAFGEDEYKKILSSLKLYSQENDTAETTSLDNVKYPILSVSSPGKVTYQFAIIGSKWDIIYIAFYKRLLL